MTQDTHALVPKQRILSDKEKVTLLKEISLEASDLPKIDIKDAGIESLSPKSADIIEIIRTSKNAGESKYYRVVING